jgi:hypothetical protein
MPSRQRIAILLLAIVAAICPARVSADSGFARWVNASATRRAAVASFVAYLKKEHVDGIVATDELFLNATHWRGCGTGAPWSVAERELWPHVVGTLRFVRDEVKPVLGPVDVVSAYRDATLNACSGGAPKSAHRNFYALDLVPKKKMSRAALIKRICLVHARFGAHYHVGLGFYDGLRFHVDTQSYRLWGSDFHAATSPCLTQSQ